MREFCRGTAVAITAFHHLSPPLIVACSPPAASRDNASRRPRRAPARSRRCRLVGGIPGSAFLRGLSGSFGFAGLTGDSRVSRQLFFILSYGGGGGGGSGAADSLATYNAAGLRPRAVRQGRTTAAPQRKAGFLALKQCLCSQVAVDDLTAFVWGSSALAWVTAETIVLGLYASQVHKNLGPSSPSSSGGVKRKKKRTPGLSPG